jgi:hypothetical protein
MQLLLTFIASSTKLLYGARASCCQIQMAKEGRAKRGLAGHCATKFEEMDA